jgi:hypothetical protein
MPVDGLADWAARGDLPRLGGDRTDGALIEGVEVLHVFTEAPGDAVRAALPPTLHLTIPGCLYATFLRAHVSPWGSFELAEIRVGARLREKPRSLLVAAAIDNPDAAAALAAGWGYRCLPAQVSLRRFYERVAGRVVAGGRTVLEVALRDPEPIPGATLQYGPLANVASTKDGPRVVLVDPVLEFGDEQERGRPEVQDFDAAWWGEPQLRSTLCIGAFYATGNLRLAPPSSLLDPEIPSGAGAVALR